MFYFNFLSENNSDDNIVPLDASLTASGHSPCLQVLPVPNTSSQILHNSQCDLFYVPSSNYSDHISSSNHSQVLEYDLIPGVYEGGFTVWECALDLCTYLNESYASFQSKEDEKEEFKVVELGCGAGFPGITLAKRINPKVLLFSDFNEEVLRSYTWPNIHLNMDESQRKAVHCYAGDWLALSDYLNSESNCNTGNDNLPSRYNIILSAETLYSIESCAKIYTFIKRHLSSDGVAIIANKR